MGETVGHVKKVLGNLTEDRAVEAEGRAEEQSGDKPDDQEVEAMQDAVQEDRGEIHQGPASG